MPRSGIARLCPFLSPSKTWAYWCSKMPRLMAERTVAENSSLLGQISRRKTRLAVGTLAEGIAGQVDIHGARQRIGNHQGRRSQIVGLDTVFLGFPISWSGVPRKYSPRPGVSGTMKKEHP